MEHDVWRFWMTKLDAGLIIPLPAYDSDSAAVSGSKRVNPRPQSCLCLTWSGYPSNDNDLEFWPKFKNLTLIPMEGPQRTSLV